MDESGPVPCCWIPPKSPHTWRHSEPPRAGGKPPYFPSTGSSRKGPEAACSPACLLPFPPADASHFPCADGCGTAPVAHLKPSPEQCRDVPEAGYHQSQKLPSQAFAFGLGQSQVILQERNAGGGSGPAFPSPSFCTSAVGVVLTDVLGQQGCTSCRGTVPAWHMSWLRTRWGLFCRLFGSFFLTLIRKIMAVFQLSLHLIMKAKEISHLPVSGVGSN